ncbi:Pseudouridine synthase I [Trypanosoma melophagium]|uniref:Pseudouridine synthase I n=1 Tax=Trypanosoma melophagium TaxID=715481 RepID=UPI00351A5EE7|nr:Pseudouridine synthase I [Trypanosoma melophagium]
MSSSGVMGLAENDNNSSPLNTTTTTTTSTNAAVVPSDAGIDAVVPPPGTSSTVETRENEVMRDGSSTKRPKRKVAIIFGYIGERYCGLQWNHLPDYPTVEEELLRALHQTDMISKENYDQEKVQQKLNWERASRTDKGVHALRNVISVNIMLPYAKGSTTEYDTLEAKRLLTEVLPNDIIVYDIVPVTRSFNAYMMCGARTYEYYLPTFAFMSHEEYCNRYFPPAVAPSRPTLEEVGMLGVGRGNNTKLDGTTSTRSVNQSGMKRFREETEKECEGIKKNNTNEELNDNEQLDDNNNNNNDCGEKEKEKDDDNDSYNSKDNGTDNENKTKADVTVEKFHDGLFEKMLVFRTIPENTMHDVAQYRLSADRLEHVRSIFREFEGTHWYHNFTPGGRASDPSSARYITSVTVSDPFIVDPADSTLLATLQEWNPSRSYSPDDEKVQPEKERDNTELEQQRRDMRDHMLRIYGNTSSENKEEDNTKKNVGIEVVRVELHGQSFMFNQIRKMIGAVSAMCAAGQPPEYLRNHLLNKSVRCGTPMVPANGLFLSNLDFQRYNYRLERIQREGRNGGNKDGVYLDRVDENAVSEFRRKIVAVVLRNEMVGDMMGRWMRSLRHVLRLACRIELP